MHVRAALSLGDFRTAVVDVVPMVDARSRVLVSCRDGSLFVVDAEAARIERRLRDGEGDPAGIVCVERELVVRCGHEAVQAIDLATGVQRWSIDEGDHSLDFDDGDCLASPGPPYAVLVNGQVLDTRTGRPAEGRPFLRDPGRGAWHMPTVFTTSAAHGLLIALDSGGIVRWDARRSGLLSQELTAPGSALALAWTGENAAVVTDDGAVYGLTASGARELAAAVGKPMRALLAASDDGRTLLVVRETSAGGAGGTLVDWIELGPPPVAHAWNESAATLVSGATAVRWLSDGLVALTARGLLRLFRRDGSATMEAPRLPHPITTMLRVGSDLVVGDAAGGLHFLSPDAGASAGS